MRAESPMKVVHVKNPESREACLAQLCANVYGREAGLAPLVTFAGTLGVLFEQEAARLFALTDDDRQVLSLALVSADTEGRSMELAMVSTPQGDGHSEHSARLIRLLAEKAPLRVLASDADAERFFRDCGITRWIDAEGGMRVGLAPRHPEPQAGKLPGVVRFDGEGIVKTFKADPETFESYKQRFVAALERFPQSVI